MTTLNIRTEKVVKDQAEEIFNELGHNMTTAINMFLRTAIREHGIPFDLKLDVPNDTTAATRKDVKDRIDDLSTFLDEQTEAITEYSDTLVRRLIERITVFDEMLVAWFKSGLEIQVEV